MENSVQKDRDGKYIIEVLRNGGHIEKSQYTFNTDTRRRENQEWERGNIQSGSDENIPDLKWRSTEYNE